MKYTTYSEYKPSHVDWLGDVASHWAVKAIKWESPVFRGASPRPIDDPIYFDDDGEYAWVRIADVTEAGMYLEYTEQNLSDVGSRLSVKLKPGDLFLSIAGTVGKPCITRIKCCIHDGFVYFPRWKADPKFLYYLFASGEPYKGLGKMGTQLNLNTDTVGSIVIGLPDADEQQTIARFLDAKTAQIDELIAKKHQLIAKLKEKRSALIARTVTRGLPPEVALAAGLEPNPEMKDSGVDWLGAIPGHWSIEKFSREVHIAEGQVDPEMEPFASMVLIAPNHIESGTGRLLALETAAEQFAESGKYLCPADAVIYSKIRPALRKVVIAPEPCLCSADMYPLTCKKKLLNSYLYWLLLSDQFSAWSVLEADRVAMPKINRETLNELRLPVPPQSEQVKIADYLKAETAKVDHMLTKADAVISSLTEYRQALITSAVTGKIDVRELA